MKCPVCEKPIERGKVVACVRCFALFPGSERQRIKEIYVRAHRGGYDPGESLRLKIDKLARITRERYPQTRPLGLTAKSPTGPEPFIGMDLASGPDRVAHIEIE